MWKNKMTQDIKINNLTVKTQTNMIHLRDLEFNLIKGIYSSKELFEKITSQIKYYYFTFRIYKDIFDYLTFYIEENNSFPDTSKYKEIAFNIHNKYDHCPLNTLSILTDKTKCKVNDIDLDIFEINDFSDTKQEIFAQKDTYEKVFDYIDIEEEYGEYRVNYMNGMVLEVVASDILHLPKEICDTFEYTYKQIIARSKTDNYTLYKYTDGGYLLKKHK